MATRLEVLDHTHICWRFPLKGNMICRMNIKMFHLQNFVAYTNQGSLLKLFLASLKIHFWLLKFKLLNVVLTVVIHFILLSADGSKNIC